MLVFEFIILSYLNGFSNFELMLNLGQKYFDAVQSPASLCLQILWIRSLLPVEEGLFTSLIDEPLTPVKQLRIPLVQLRGFILHTQDWE